MGGDYGSKLDQMLETLNSIKLDLSRIENDTNWRQGTTEAKDGLQITPYSVVRERYHFPFPLYEFQQNAVNELARLPRSALYWEPGLGKTAGSTHCALFQMESGCDITLVILPPILINTWQRWLARVKRRNGSPLRVTVYRGTPRERQGIGLDGEFILMSQQIFKKDYERVCKELGQKRCHVILDEAQSIKNIRSQNFKMFRDFTANSNAPLDSPFVSLELRLLCLEGKSFQLLTGTPLNNPMDAYGYIRLVSPSIYRNLAQFTRIHVEEVDFFNKPVKFCNLELLSSNLMVNADRKTKEQVLLELPDCIITPIEYELEKPHQKLYEKLAYEQLLKLPDGEQIDAMQATALYHALGQIVMQWAHFSGDESKVSAGFDLITETLDEIGSAKLIVFANYRRTNAEITKRFNCPGVWGDIPAAQKQDALNAFMNDPNCRLITLQPTSAGIGLDGMQHVCSDVIFIEPPIAVSHFVQALSRVHRDGQLKPVTVRVATALGTIQQHLVKSLTAKDALVSPLQGSKARLQAALFGE